MLWKPIIDQGLAWQRTLTYKIAGTAVNLTGYTATVRIGGVVITSAAGVTLGGSAGTVQMNLTAEQTAQLNTGGITIEVDLVSGGGVALPRLVNTATVQ